ncbi:hypothetical protein PENSPDRAFT_680120 [Peniophora sp. CONT]|nr:hypothetical protein PENSPDRAFT_680120 [Peniophora sp. CONT]
MFYNTLISSIGIALAALAAVKAEQHLVHFDNRCGFGTPTLIGEGGVTFSTGGDVLFESEIRGLIAYLQTGGCGFNGEGCLTVEASLVNGQSSADLTLIPPHSFSVTSGFGYFDGCDGSGADCNNAGCNTAFHVSTDTFVQVGCGAGNENLAITFCD